MGLRFAPVNIKMLTRGGCLPRTMACVMTVIAFARPGDLYGMPIDINVPAYGLKLMSLGASEREGGPND